MADTPKHSVSVAGIVVDDQDRVLVIQRRDNGHWEPPGGVLELDETPDQGVRREVFEETGIAVRTERLTGVYKNMSQHVVALVFRCAPVAGSAAPSAESQKARWIPASEVLNMMDESYAIRVQDALIGIVAVRVHDGVRLLAGG